MDRWMDGWVNWYMDELGQLKYSADIGCVKIYPLGNLNNTSFGRLGNH